MKNTKPIGINYPMTVSGGHFDQTYYSIDNERVKLIALMRTIEGERFMQPTFGLNLYPYLFEQINSLLSSKIEEEIRKKVSFWLPNVVILSMNIDITSGVDQNQIIVNIDYGLKSNPTDTASITFNF